MRLLCGVGVGAWNREQIRADRPELPLASFGDGLVFGPCTHGCLAHAEKAGKLGVVGESEGCSYCTLGHVHARESIAMNSGESICLNSAAGTVRP